jgi:hypothetical protein
MTPRVLQDSVDEMLHSECVVHHSSTSSECIRVAGAIEEHKLHQCKGKTDRRRHHQRLRINLYAHSYRRNETSAWRVCEVAYRVMHVFADAVAQNESKRPEHRDDLHVKERCLEVVLCHLRCSQHKSRAWKDLEEAFMFETWSVQNSEWKPAPLADSWDKKLG